MEWLNSQRASAHLSLTMGWPLDTVTGILFCAVYLPLHHGGDTAPAAVAVCSLLQAFSENIQILPKRVLSEGS